jgi:hypothetical protein
MNLTAFVDVAIGLSLVYLGASLYVTIVNEFIAQTFGMRGKQLGKDLLTLIDDPNLRTRLAQSPSLRPFFDAKGRPSSYIDPVMLARLLVGAVRSASTGVATMQGIVGAIDSLPPSNVQVQLAALARSTSQNVDEFVETVGRWADRSLTTLGEVYKKRFQLISFGIGLAAAVAFDLNTLTIVDRLYRDNEARDATVAIAVEFASRTRQDTFDTCMGMPAQQRAAAAQCAPIRGLVDAVRTRNETFGRLPILWQSREGVWATLREAVPGGDWKWVGHWMGWLITALAVSLGAPFWFDLLNRLINVRHGMRRPATAAGSG